MFAKLSERTIQWIRWGLVAGWLLLIVSLFFDPFTSRFTNPANDSSPFRLNASAADTDGVPYSCPYEGPDGEIDWAGFEPGTCDSRCTTIRGECVIEREYAMGARIFWTMALPLLPLAFMVLGHEMWRRICPLSALSQIPRKLGWQRKRPHLQRSQGSVQWRHVFVDPNSWVGRHPAVLPFILLCTGVTVRLLFINSNPTALGTFFLGVIGIALFVGYRYGGKTWCHYICPLSPVQKIYTEPRGLLESAPHIQRTSVPQSMCRETTSDGDASTCVGCISACPDVDLERQYWERVHEPGRRFVHYGYIGMILGFYGYYALYAGNWSYYFSGAWTHEEGQIDALLSPGFFWLNEGTWLVKLIAAPLTIAVSVLLSFSIGVAIEKLIIWWRDKKNGSHDHTLLRHRSYIISGALAINAFYFFGGRPNIQLFPSLAISIFDFSVAALSAIWLARGWARSKRSYMVESVASRLRRQLEATDIDLSDALDGRTVSELSYEEIYALGKVLPSVDASTRRKLYREALRDAISSGMVVPGSIGELVLELQAQLGISESEHREILAELGVVIGESLDPTEIRNAEELWRTNAYREALERKIGQVAETGAPLRETLRNETIQREIASLQGAYRITDEQHIAVVESLVGGNGLIVRGANKRLERILSIAGFEAFVVSHPGKAHIAALVQTQLRLEKEQIAREIFRVIASLKDTAEAIALSRRVAVAVPVIASEMLQARVEEGKHHERWSTLLGETASDAIRSQVAVAKLHAAATMDEQPLDGFLQLFDRLHPLTQVAVTAWATFYESGAAAQIGERLRPEQASSVHNWILRATADVVAESSGTSYPEVIDWIALLHLTDFYADASPSSIAGLVRDGTLERAANGDVLYAQGDESEDVICIVEGEAEVIVQADDGARIPLAVVHPGETVGELGLINNQLRSATVLVRSDEMRFLRISRESFDNYLAYEAKNVLQLVSRRLTQTLQLQAS